MPIKQCRYCGKPFIAKDKRMLYCSKNCKNTGAAEKRREDPINREMDHARRVHLYRRSVQGKTRAAMKAYDEWLEFAKKAEESCRKGEISIAKLTESIGVDYKEDWVVGEKVLLR